MTEILRLNIVVVLTDIHWLFSVISDKYVNNGDCSVSSAVEGAGIELIELMCLALSVLRRLLQLSPEGAISSPIAVSLSARPSGRSDKHLVTTVAQYIYHRQNPLLPSLATKLLSSLSVVRISLLVIVVLLFVYICVFVFHTA